MADIRDAIAASHAAPAGDVLYRHLKRSGRLATLIASAERGDDAALRNVARFFEIVRGQAALLQEDRLPFLVPHLATLIEAGDDPADAEADEPADAVSVLTIHKAKGLEFPVVFLVGLRGRAGFRRGRRDRLPLPDALRRTPAAGEEAAWSEERRLCYVRHDAGAGRAAAQRLHPRATVAVAGGRPRSSPRRSTVSRWRVTQQTREGEPGRLLATFAPPMAVPAALEGTAAQALAAVELP